MGRPDNEQKGSSTEGNQLSQAILKAMTEHFENLQKTLILQSNQEIERLQAENSRLHQEIEELKSQRQQQEQQQDNQPQQLVKQLAEVLATQLAQELMQQLHQIANKVTSSITTATDTSLLSADALSSLKENSYKLIASLDSTLRTMFEALEEDINNYHSTLSERLNRLESMENQGELILQNLVERLEEELHKQASATSFSPTATSALNSLNSAVAPSPASQEVTETVAQPQLGFSLILLSTIALSLHHIAVKIVSTQTNLFGILPLGGFIELDLGNSLLLFWVRMVVVLPLIALLAKTLHSSVWTELRNLFAPLRLRPLLSLIGSSFCLFVSQVLLYISIGEINPAIAVTLLFLYPIITLPLSWLFFKVRPSRWSIGVAIALALGGGLAALPNPLLLHNSVLGLGAGLLSGISFAVYLFLMQLGVKRIHPVSVTVLQFFIMFLVSSLSLLLPFQLDINLTPMAQQGILVGGTGLGILTMLGYLFNYCGVKAIKPIQASILASITPIFTAVLSFLIIPGVQVNLKWVQGLGIVLVSLGVFALSYEQMRSQRRAREQAET